MTKLPTHIQQSIDELNQINDREDTITAVNLINSILDKLKQEGIKDLFLCANLYRLKGRIYRNLEDINASSNSFQSAVDILDGHYLNYSEVFLLAETLRFLAYNMNLTGELSSAKKIRQRVLNVLENQLEKYPENTTSLIIGLLHDVEAKNSNEWQNIMQWLDKNLKNLSLDSTLRVNRELYFFWESKENESKMAEILLDSYHLIEFADHKTILKNFSSINNIAWASLNPGNWEITNDFISKLKPVLASVNNEQEYAFLRLSTQLLSQIEYNEETLDEFSSLYFFALEKFGEEDNRTRKSLRDLADAHSFLENQDQAIEYYKEAVKIELRLEEHTLETAELINFLAKELDYSRRFQEAIDAYKLSLDMHAYLLGQFHPKIFLLCYQVGEMNRVLERYHESELYFTKALEVEKSLDKPSVEVSSMTRNNLGEVYNMLGRKGEAKSLISEGLKIRMENYSEDSKEVWRSRYSLAHVTLEMGDPDFTLFFADEAIKKSDLKHHAEWGIIIAKAYLIQGNIEEAINFYEFIYKHIPIDEVEVNCPLTSYFNILEGLMLCQSIKKNWSKVINYPMPLLERLHFLIVEIIQKSSEIQIRTLSKKALNIQSLWVQALLKNETTDSEKIKSSFNFIQIFKGLVTRYLKYKQPGDSLGDRISPHLNKTTIKKTKNEIETLKNELIDVFLKSKNRAQTRKTREVRIKLARISELERFLATDILDAETLSNLYSNVDDLNIPEKTILLDIVAIHSVTIEDNLLSSQPIQYVGFILGLNSDDYLELVDIGDYDNINIAVNELRVSIMDEQWNTSANPPDWYRLTGFLGQRILKPIWRSIEKLEHIIISPDGKLVSLPFEMLRYNSDKCLSDGALVSYISRALDIRVLKKSIGRADDPLILADPDYDLFYNNPKITLSNSNSSTQNKIYFERLEETAEEGKAIAKHLKVEPLLGKWAFANELSKSGSPEIIHISTHGFYLPFKNPSQEENLINNYAWNDFHLRATLEDSMDRCGLAFAGVNAVLNRQKLPKEIGHGLIYASEIALMNLQKTDLVVLSACRSGLGDYLPGDGAQGIRKAFLAAGCKSVVSALWDVPEKSSKKLIEMFYSKILLGKKRHEALASSKNELRKEYPNDPIHWAGFVLDGNFDSLWRFRRRFNFDINRVTGLDFGDPKFQEKHDLMYEHLDSNVFDPSELGIPELRRLSNDPDCDETNKSLAKEYLEKLAIKLGEALLSIFLLIRIF
ncbi:MAG: CHAT domain-containing tetratricopeptide repeat protein [Saonia sp.]